MLPGPFEALVGRDHVRAPTDERIDDVRVAIEVCPSTPEETAACLRVAREQRVAVVASGGGSKLGWGNLPDTKELLRLSLARLDGTLDLDADEGVGVIGAGVRLDRLREATLRIGRRTRLDTPHDGATAGGTVATDAFGATHDPARSLRNDLLGIQVALPNGTLARAGGRVVKNVTGFDLVRLQCGAYGTLGIITELAVRLRPVPAERRTLRRDLSSSEEALRAAGELCAAPVHPAGSAVVGSRLLWVLEGSVSDVAERASRFGSDPAAPDDWDEVERLIVEPPRTGHSRVRILGPHSRVPALAAWLSSSCGTPRVVLPGAGIVIGDLPERDAVRRITAGRGEGLTLFVESGSTALKGSLDVFGSPPEAMAVMRGLKERFDPDRIVAPGRFLGRI